MFKGRERGHQTQWAAQFAAASELCKRGYEVALTMGHTTPIADLMVVSPNEKKTFLVDVKGLYRKNPWIIKRKTKRADLFFILVHVPTETNNQFFIMTQRQVDREINLQMKRLGRPDDYKMTGFNWNRSSRYENAWNVLPQ